MVPHPERHALPVRSRSSQRILADGNPGPSALVPGLVQLCWGQRERGLVFLVTFLSALVACGLCWGDRLSWVFLGTAFACHALSLVDLARQRAFPVFHSWTAGSAIMLALGSLLYAPIMGTLWLFACPVATTVSASGYLVNSLAYRQVEPAPGEWIWLRDIAEQQAYAGKVLAVGGQEVEWTGRRWRVDGKNMDVPRQNTSAYYPISWKFQVPREHLLVDRDPGMALAGLSGDSPLAIVSRNDVVGRAWARYRPFWDRRLL